MPQSNESNKDLILGWLSRLSKHFGVELSEDQITIYLTALTKCGPGQINAAFSACLNECQFMPKLAEIHKRMPESEQTTKPWGFVQSTPTLELVRPVALEISKSVTGREYNDLDTIKDARLIQKVFRTAAIVRYLRMGIKVTWIPLEELNDCKELV